MARRFGQIMAGLMLLALAEVLLAVLVAQWIGVGWTLLIIVGMSVMGGLLLRREGMRAWRRFREVSDQPDVRPGPEVIDGLVGLGGGLLLTVPGFLTGFLGLLCLLPPTRRLFRGGAQRLAERRLSPGVVGDLFGPRRVRARRGAPVRSDVGSAAGGGPAAGGFPPQAGTSRTPSGSEGEIIEGEIVDR